MSELEGKQRQIKLVLLLQYAEKVVQKEFENIWRIAKGDWNENLENNIANLTSLRILNKTQKQIISTGRISAFDITLMRVLLVESDLKNSISAELLASIKKLADLRNQIVHHSEIDNENFERIWNEVKDELVNNFAGDKNLILAYKNTVNNIEVFDQEGYRISVQFNEKGNDLFNQKLFSEAIEIYTKALENTVPDSLKAKIYSNLSVCYLSLAIGSGKTNLNDNLIKQSINCAKLSKNILPKWFRVYDRLGSIYQTCAVYDKATRYFEIALIIDANIDPSIKSSIQNKLWDCSAKQARIDRGEPSVLEYNSNMREQFLEEELQQMYPDDGVHTRDDLRRVMSNFYPKNSPKSFILRAKEHLLDNQLEEAALSYAAAANAGDPEGMYNYAFLLMKGRGVEKDIPNAIYWHTRAANSPPGKLLPGEMRTIGIAESQHSLALCYYSGIGVSKDYQKAFEWELKSAKENYAPALNTMGTFYDKGVGVDVDHETALDYYRTAAIYGDSIAYANISICYKNGIGGVNVNLKKSLLWAECARDKGVLYVQKDIDTLKQLMERFPCSEGEQVITPRKVLSIRRLYLVCRLRKSIQEKRLMINPSTTHYKPPVVSEIVINSNNNNLLLNSITMEEMYAKDKDKIYRDQILNDCMLISQPYQVQGYFMIARDSEGEIFKVAFYNVSNSHLSKLQVGQKFSIINPYFRITATTERLIRVDDMKSVCFGDYLNICWTCLKTDEKLSSCGKCKMAKYCSATCQREDWTSLGHKYDCA